MGFLMQILLKLSQFKKKKKKQGVRQKFINIMIFVLIFMLIFTNSIWSLVFRQNKLNYNFFASVNLATLGILN